MLDLTTPLLLESPPVGGSVAARITASGRTCQHLAAPSLLPESDTGFHGIYIVGCWCGRWATAALARTAYGAAADSFRPAVSVSLLRGCSSRVPRRACARTDRHRWDQRPGDAFSSAGCGQTRSHPSEPSPPHWRTATRDCQAHVGTAVHSSMKGRPRSNGDRGDEQAVLVQGRASMKGRPRSNGDCPTT